MSEKSVAGRVRKTYEFVTGRRNECSVRTMCRPAASRVRGGHNVPHQGTHPGRE